MNSQEVELQASTQTNEANLLAELIDHEADPSSKEQFARLLLERPDWQMGKLTRPFLRVYRAIEDAAWAADQWAMQTSKELKKILEEVPQQWKGQANDRVMGRIFGEFFAISEQYSVSMYLQIFEPLKELPNTFASNVQIPHHKIHLQNKNIPLRKIGVYWLNYEHHYQMQGTLREAGDMYFVFLRGLQRFFAFRHKEDTTKICDELFADIDQLCENLIKSHRSHLSYLYYGLQAELYQYVNHTLHHKRSLQIYWKLKKITKLQEQEALKLVRYEQAIEKMLEGFHLYLRCLQMQLNLKNTAFFEINTFTAQQKKIEKALKESLEGIEELLEKIKQKTIQPLTYQECHQKLNEVEEFFKRKIAGTIRVVNATKNNPRTKNFPILIAGKYDFIAQSLPEYADIIHFQKLWSWTKSKIEVDIETPLRFPAEQLFLRRIEKIVPIHQNWSHAIAKWLQDLEHQEYFFKLSIRTILQEWENKTSQGTTLKPEELHDALKSSLAPFEDQMTQMLLEVDSQFENFLYQTNLIINELVIDFRNLIFDPDARWSFLNISLRGEGLRGIARKILLQFQYTKSLKKYTAIFTKWNKMIWFKWHKIAITWRAYGLIKTQKIPLYYSHVFVPNPLEVKSLFVGREKELKQLEVWAKYISKKQNTDPQLILLFGEVGVGIRSLVEYFVQKNNYSLIKIWLTFENKKIKIFMGEKEIDLEGCLKRLMTDQMLVVSLQIIDHSFLESVQNIQVLKQFLKQFRKAPILHLYLFHMTEFLWKSLSQIDEVKEAFTTTKQITPMTQETLEQMIYQRHRVVDYPLYFMFPKKRSYYLLHKIFPKFCQKITKNCFFQELAKRSQGNPTIAMQLWIHQCLLGINKQIVLMPFQNEKSYTLQQNELLILRVILTQGTVSIQTLNESKFVQNLHTSLQSLTNKTLICMKDSMLTINPKSYQFVYQLLKKSALLE